MNYIRRQTAQIKRFFEKYAFSSLSRRILFLNLIVILILSFGILYLNQFRTGLILARTEALTAQGQIIAAAIAASATVDTDVITINPEDLLNLDTGESLAPFDSIRDPYDFPLNPERVAPIIRQLVSPIRTRARLYDHDTQLIIDSRFVYGRGSIISFDIAPPKQHHERGYLGNILSRLLAFFNSNSLPQTSNTYSEEGMGFDELEQALNGNIASFVRQDPNGKAIVYVAVPVQRFRSIYGALLLSTNSDEIDKIVEAEQLAILRLMLIAIAASSLLSILLAATITSPVKKLSLAALKVQRGIANRVNIPEFSDRHDEIGNLSRVLNTMTTALYQRLDAIEAFAADVAHEIKNPLTSIRSAVETLPKVQNEEQQKRLLAIINHDVQRLDRLISDISDASRLDAELARANSKNLNIHALLTGLLSTLKDATTKNENNIDIQFTSLLRRPAQISGHSSRLGQVIANLIDNARSFSPENGIISVTLSELDSKKIIIHIDDDGKGIAEDNLVRIFERFYTDRSEQSGFGQNSGLGLSISKQIIEAHGGDIYASNRYNEQGDIIGARFSIELPKTTQKTKKA